MSRLISSLADRLLVRLVPKTSAAAATCAWRGCPGNPCLAEYRCCHCTLLGCTCWTAISCTWTC